MKFSPEDIQQAKDANLVELLQDLHFPLKKITDREYCLLAHDSCRISPNKGFYWHSRGVGGNAIDFFMTVENMSFIESVETILSKIQRRSNFATNCREVEKTKLQKKEPFELPVTHWNNNRIITYLTKERMLDEKIVLYCIKKKILYESAKTHNAVFIGQDENGKACYAFQRGTTKKRYAGDAPGSNKEYGFFLGRSDANILHLFESPIDLLSFLTLEKYQNRKCNDAYLSLSGISLKAFDHFVSHHTHVNTVYVRSDNDDAGHRIYTRLLHHCSDQSLDISIIPAFPEAKDYNDQLKNYKGKENL